MKIACVDKTANDRIKLVNYFEQAFENSRSTLGFLRISEFTPFSKNEILLCSSFDAIVIGSAFSEEEISKCLKEFKETHPNLPILIILTEDRYNLKTLKRFNHLNVEIFSLGESPARIVNFLCSMNEKKYQNSLGKLISINGAKGGVGASSIATALAHAAIAVEKSCILVDLSLNSCLLHYLGTPKWQSADYARALIEERPIDKDFIQKIITTAPNGIDILLPPAGSKETRELWLRNQSCFEFSLEIIEALRGIYQIVIVDIAGSEGILPFAINSRSFSKILVSSNEPASVYLLNNKLSELSETPGNSDVTILINQLVEKGLSLSDVKDFISINSRTNSNEQKFFFIPYDRQGRHWVGTGNSFYTQGSKTLKATSENLVLTILDENDTLQAKSKSKKSWMKSIVAKLKPEEDLFFNASKNKNIQKLSWDFKTPSEEEKLNFDFPKLRANSKGNLSLEFLLFLTGAIVLAATTLPIFINNIQSYLLGFTESTNNN